MHPNQHAEPDPEILGQARSTISDTRRTLDELHESIRAFLPLHGNPGKHTTLQFRYKYLLHEKSIQTMLLRLHARRDALSLIANMWSR